LFVVLFGGEGVKAGVEYPLWHIQNLVAHQNNSYLRTCFKAKI